MARYRITGANRTTGVDVVIEVEAVDFRHAESQANECGLMVANVEQVFESPPVPARREAPFTFAPQMTAAVTTKNTVSLTLGIIATIVGAVAMLVGWIPFLGLLSIPFAVIGALLAGIGILAALLKGGRGFGMPALGGFLCILAAVISVAMTGGASSVLAEAGLKAAEAAERQRAIQRGEAGEAATNIAAVERTAMEAEKSAYIRDCLVIYDLKAEYMDSVLNGKIPGVLFKIRNAGDRALSRVKVVVYFKDTNGNIVAEEDFFPVLVSNYSFARDSRPLKPGYVWQMESGKFYAAKSVPSEWDEGGVRAEIAEIEFAD